MGKRLFTASDYPSERFFTPATQAFWDPLERHIFASNHLISHSLTKHEDLAKHYGLTPGAPLELRFGEEFEILLLHPDYDPMRHPQHGPGNPNYTVSHLRNIADLMNAAEDELGDMLLRRRGADQPGRITLELRTEPADVVTTQQTQEQIGDWMRAQTKQRGLCPIVFSHHIHASCLQEGRNVFYDEAGEPTRLAKLARYGTQELLYRALPLTRLPEDISSAAIGDYGSNYRRMTLLDVVAARAPQFKREFQTLEQRMTLNEFAHDPKLNLALMIMGMRDGTVLPAVLEVFFNNSPFKIDCMDYKEHPERVEARIGDFEYHLKKMRDDALLAGRFHFGPELLAELADVVEGYWKGMEERLARSPATGPVPQVRFR